MGRTLRNVCHCGIAEIRFVGKLVIIQTFVINQRIEFYLNNTNLRPLTPHIMPCYRGGATHEMAVVSWPEILCRHFTICILIGPDVD